MFRKVRLSAGALALVASSAGAQVTNAAPRVFRVERGDSPRAVIGVSTSGSASKRDTLGLLITAITPKGPAEKAGLEEGNRIASVNGTNLRLSPNDVDDWEMQGIMQRRLTRELSKLKPGDDVELRVWAGGQYKTVHVKTAESEDVYTSVRRRLRDDLDDRPTLGLGIGSTGSRRDTLGVFVMYVSDSGPAARAGIVEGDRIASINGVDVRVSRDDAGDAEIAGIKARRLEREVSNLKPGDDADLRVWSDGQFRNLKVKVARAADLPHRRNSVFIMGGLDGMVAPMAPMPPMPPMPAMPGVELRMDPEAISIPTQRVLRRAMEAAQRAMENSQRAIERASRAWQNEDSYDWNDESWDDADTPTPAVAPSPSRTPAARTPAPSRARSSSATAAALAPDDAWTNVGFATAPVVASASFGGRISAIPAVAWSSDDDDGATIDIDGLRLAPVNSELAAYLGKGTERGALVVAAPSWTPELRSGDVILSIDDEPVSRNGGLSVAIDRSHPSTITFLRDGKKHVTTAKR